MTTKNIGFHYLLKALEHGKDFSPAVFSLLSDAYAQHMAEKRSRPRRTLPHRRLRNPALPPFSKIIASIQSRKNNAPIKHAA